MLELLRKDWDNALWLLSAGYFLYYWHVPSTVLYDEHIVQLV